MLKAIVVCVAVCATGLPAGAQTAGAPAVPLATVPVRAAAGVPGRSFDAVVEAVRQTVVAAQVPGAVVALNVKAGDTVKPGQVLARIDARAAEQTAAASQAQVKAAQAMLDVARKDYERQQQLFGKDYISRAALERAESQFKAAQAQAAALLAQAGAARTESGFHVVRAPYAGIVSEVPVAVGDMAMPGRALLAIYEPGALRVTAAVPQSALATDARAKDAGTQGGQVEGGRVQGARVEFPALPTERRWFAAPAAQVLPTVDAATHSVTLRIPLPADFQGVAPGSFARVWLPGGADAAAQLAIPLSAVVRRAEMTGVYVVDAKGMPHLRQVRLGRVAGEMVEVLAGVSTGERVALDPQAAARVR